MGRWWDHKTELPISIAARRLRVTSKWVRELMDKPVEAGGLEIANRYGPRKTTVTRASVEARLDRYAAEAEAMSAQLNLFPASEPPKKEQSLKD